MTHPPDNLESAAAAYSLIFSDAAAARGTVILIHGLTGTPAEMRGLADCLHDKGFNAIVPRLSGHGERIEKLRRIRAEVWISEVAAAARQAQQLGRPLSFVGLSFGGLLALNAAIDCGARCRAVAAMSVPMTLEPAWKDLLLRGLSRLPDSIVNRLWVQAKQKRREGYLALPHHAYPQHSVGAAARLIQVRRRVISRLSQVRCPVLIYQDPLDHHLPAAAAFLLQDRLLNSESRVHFVPDGQHELLLGHKHQLVISETCRFIEAAHAGDFNSR